MATKMKHDDTDFPELNDDQLDRMRPAHEVMPPAFFNAVARKQGQRGPAKKPRKVAISLRIDADVHKALTVSGAWRDRVNDILRKALKVKA